jgi:hypothetical protein
LLAVEIDTLIPRIAIATQHCGTPRAAPHPATPATPVGGRSSMLGYALLQFGVRLGSPTGGAIGWGRGSVEPMALWIPAVMMALEIMSIVNRVTNPSAVKRTRKARMRELKGQNSRPSARPRARGVQAPRRSTACR